MDDWRRTTIGDELTLQRGFDITKVAQRHGAIPVISSGGTSSYHDQSMAHGPGVILGRKGVVGSVYYVDGDYWPHDTTLWVKDFKGNVPQFVYYFFRSFAPILATMDVGSANPTLNRNHVHPIKVIWPSVRWQNGIASVLGALDDKIDLNRRMNETLEAMARAIFKDWFVDFGPVRAKAEGRPPYLAPELWSLFPDALDDEDKPIGWKMVPIYDIAQYDNGAAYKDIYFTDDRTGMPVVRIGELKNGITGQTNFTNTDLGARYRIDTGDILFSWSGSPDTSIDIFIWDKGKAVLNQHIFVVRENGAATKMFTFFQLKALKSTFIEIARNKQTTGLGHVTAGDMKRLLVCKPMGSVAKAFDAQAQPIFDRILSAMTESHVLVQLRDFLLPKLMSGEIRLNDAERAVENAL